VTPNDIHFLTALLLSADGSSLTVECGAWIYSQASKTKRDLDIIVQVPPPDIPEHRFRGFEVKDHGRPLSSEEVEGLIRKMQDMPDIEDAAIVSSSGFARPALEVCRYHRVQAYSLRDWNPEDDLFAVSFAAKPKLTQTGVVWDGDVRMTLIVDEDPNVVKRSKPCDAQGNLRDDTRTFDELGTRIGHLLPQLIADAGLQLSYGRSVWINESFDVSDTFVKSRGKVLPVSAVRVRGWLRMEKQEMDFTYKMLMREFDSRPLVGCGLYCFPSGPLLAMMTSHIPGDVRIGHIDAVTRMRKKVFKVRFQNANR
jgi:hypothetical protein